MEVKCGSCRTCARLLHGDPTGSGDSYNYCGKIPNCDENALVVTTMDDEGGQFAVLVIKDPTAFGCFLHDLDQQFAGD